MGMFNRGSPNQEQAEMPRDGQCPHRHHGPPGPHWFNSPRHNCPESARHHGPPHLGFFRHHEARDHCPRSGPRPPFFGHGTHEFPKGRPCFGHDNGGEFGRHEGRRPPFFGHRHHWHGPHHGGHDDQSQEHKFRGCPLSRWGKHDYKPVFERRLWE